MAKETMKLSKMHKTFKEAKGEAEAMEKKGKKRWKAEEVHATNKTLTKVKVAKDKK